jgi:hypothetical protein
MGGSGEAGPPGAPQQTTKEEKVKYLINKDIAVVPI